MGAPNAKYMQNDLNQGGRYTILANNKGRIRLQGPYIIDTEGYPDGTEALDLWDSHIPKKNGILPHSYHL